MTTTRYSHPGQDPHRNRLTLAAMRAFDGEDEEHAQRFDRARRALSETFAQYVSHRVRHAILTGAAGKTYACY